MINTGRHVQLTARIGQQIARNWPPCQEQQENLDTCASCALKAVPRIFTALELVCLIYVSLCSVLLRAPTNANYTCMFALMSLPAQLCTYVYATLDSGCRISEVPSYARIGAPWTSYQNKTVVVANGESGTGIMAVQLAKAAHFRLRRGGQTVSREHMNLDITLVCTIIGIISASFTFSFFSLVLHLLARITQLRSGFF